MEKIQEKEIKAGKQVWWIEHYNSIANVFEGEYIADIDQTFQEGSVLVRELNGRNIVVSNAYENREEALEEAYTHNKWVAEIRESEREKFEQLEESFKSLERRVKILEKKRFSLF